MMPRLNRWAETNPFLALLSVGVVFIPVRIGLDVVTGRKITEFTFVSAVISALTIAIVAYLFLRWGGKIGRDKNGRL